MRKLFRIYSSPTTSSRYVLEGIFMTLKTATKLAIAGITLNLIQSLLSPFIFSGWRFSLVVLLWIILPVVTLNVPLIIFFVILHGKQK